MHHIAQTAINQTPPECRVQAEDAQVIARHSDCLLAMGPAVVKAFYDTLYGHDQTERLFRPGERPMRERTLASWWERTVRGPLDDDYWAWMALVGLTHVVRRVTNPMMLAMTGFVAQFVETNSDALPVPQTEQRHVVTALRRVCATAGAIITFAYDHAVSSALFEVAGMPQALLARLRDQEISQALALAHTQVQLSSHN